MPTSDTKAVPTATAAAAIAALYAAVAAPVVARGDMAAETVAASVLLGIGLALASAIDLRSFRLPDAITLTLTAAGLALAWALHWEPTLWWRAAAAVGGYTFIRAIDFAYEFVRGHQGIGQGDAKLFASAGAWLGPEGLPTTLLYACAAAIVFVAACQLSGRTMTATQRIAFGPFLGFGIWLVWIWGPVTL